MSINQDEKKTLVISLPYKRLTSHISPNEVDIWLNNYKKIILVGPFDLAINGEFFKSYGKILYINKYTVTVLKISEYLRRHGFFFKYRKNFLYENFNLNHPKITSRRYKYPRLIGYLLKIGMIIGSFELSWKIMREISLVRFTGYYRELSILLKKEKIESIQYAQWGIRDAVFSVLVEKYSLKKILHTYSTDQCLNGFFFTEYDLVGIQGNKEFEYIKKYHKNQSKKTYFKNLKKEKIESFLEKNKSKLKNTILICGAHKNFYPRNDEINTIIYLLSRTKILKNFKVVYRPITDFQEDIALIYHKLSDYLTNKNFIIEPPSENLIGLDVISGLVNYDEFQKEELKYFSLLNECHTVISFIASSLLIDAERFGAYTCSYINSSDKFNKDVGTDLMLSNKSTNIYSGLDLYNNIEQLITAINDIDKISPRKNLLKNW